MTANTPIIRRHFTFSRQELERRWTLVRNHLKAKKIDALVAIGTENNLAGYNRWLTDAPIAYRRAVMFFPDDNMTLIEHGAHGSVRKMDGNEMGYPGVGEVLGCAEFPSVHYTQTYEGKMVVETLKKRGVKTVAMIGEPGMPKAFAMTIREGLSGVTFVDETDFVDQCKAIKSPEEIAVLMKTAELQDKIFQKVLREAKPGMKDVEIDAISQHEARLGGSEGGVHLCGSAPIGQAAPYQGAATQARVTQKGDHFNILIENGGAGNYFTELGRMVVFGKAPSYLTEAFELAKAAQENTLKLMTPGRPCADIYRAHSEFLAKHGLPPDKRLYAHGQGSDLVERPLMRDDEPMLIQEGQCFAVHPTFVTPQVFMVVCDNYMVEKNGVGPCMHKTEKKIFEI